MPDQPTDAGKETDADYALAHDLMTDELTVRLSDEDYGNLGLAIAQALAAARAEGARQERAKTQLACDIAAWQLTADVHPLTCGNASAHRLLVPAVVGDRIVLRCLDCAYQQDHVPDCCFRAREPREEQANG